MRNVALWTSEWSYIHVYMYKYTLYRILAWSSPSERLSSHRKFWYIVYKIQYGSPFPEKWPVQRISNLYKNPEKRTHLYLQNFTLRSAVFSLWNHHPWPGNRFTCLYTWLHVFSKQLVKQLVTAFSSSPENNIHNFREWMSQPFFQAYFTRCRMKDLGNLISIQFPTRKCDRYARWYGCS